jgi:AcrR family transcriptional regulator
MRTQTPPKPNLKEACVQAAHEFIAEKGIENLSMRDVARRLEVSHQAPYRHYPSKDHLLAAVIARCFREFASFLDARPNFDNPDDDLTALGQQYVTYAANHPLEYRLMFGTTWPEVAEDSELIQDSLHAFNVLRNVLQRIHGTGKAAKEKIDLDAMFIWSNMHGLVTIAQSNVMQHLLLAPKVEKNVAGHVFEMISAAMKSRASNP